jgi:DNA polymerase-3 subunit gamma/tau
MAKTADAQSIILSVPEENISGNRQVDADELTRCWNTYAEKLTKEVHLKNTMMTCKPVLRGTTDFEVAIHNPIQKEELINHSLQLLKVLRVQLDNSRIQMHIRIDETNEKQLAYTSQEKYELLNEINPMLSKLKDLFELEID